MPSTRWPPPVREPRAWVALPASWLMQSNLRGPVAPIRAGIGRDWQIGFMRTYVNDVAADVTRFETAENGQGLIHWGNEFEGWLYDRPGGAVERLRADRRCQVAAPRPPGDAVLCVA